MGSVPTPAGMAFDVTANPVNFDPKCECCGSCRFWLLDQTVKEMNAYSVGYGWCRRRPPKLIPAMVDIMLEKPKMGHHQDMSDLWNAYGAGDAASYPGTFCLQWCGEFEWHPRLEPIRP